MDHRSQIFKYYYSYIKKKKDKKFKKLNIESYEF